MLRSPEARTNFNKWIVVPLSKLREIPQGDGTFAALSIAFGLYERYLVSKLDAEHGDSSPQERYELASRDFDSLVTPSEFQDFWDMYRVGIQHYFQPKTFTKSKDKTRWGWDISENKDYKKYPVTIENEPNLFIITLDPWQFIEHVLQRWRETPRLINHLKTFAFGQIKTLQQPQPQSVSDQVDSVKRQDDEETSSSTNHLPSATGIVPTDT